MNSLSRCSKFNINPLFFKRGGVTYWMVLCIWMGVMGGGCKQDKENSGPVYRATDKIPQETVYYFAPNALHNPAKLLEAYQPLLDGLNSKISGVTIELEASRDFAQFEQKIRDRKPQLIRPNPWQALVAIRAGYHVVAMEGAPEDFRGLIIVRKDSGIKVPADLKGRSISYPSPTSFSACIMPQFFLQNNGVNVKTDLDNRYVGSQESSIMNVFLKLTAAGGSWPLSWRAFQKDFPIEASELKIMWETDPLINSAIMVRDDVPADLRQGLVDYLLRLDKNEKGLAILANIGIDRYRVSSDSDYDVVRKYVSEFEKKVRIISE